jgi:hypothetical protein
MLPDGLYNTLIMKVTCQRARNTLLLRYTVVKVALLIVIAFVKKHSPINLSTYCSNSFYCFLTQLESHRKLRIRQTNADILLLTLAW